MSAQEIIDAGQGILPIVDTCKLLGISRSSYYHQRSKKPSARALKDTALMAEIRAVFTKTRKRYGSPRIMRALRKRGVRVGKKRVARLMRQNGLVAEEHSKSLRHYSHTSRHSARARTPTICSSASTGETDLASCSSTAHLRPGGRSQSNSPWDARRSSHLWSAPRRSSPSRGSIPRPRE